MSFFLWPRNIPLYGHITFSLPIREFLDIGVVCTLGLLRVVLLGVFIHVQNFVWVDVCVSLGYIPRSVITGSRVYLVEKMDEISFICF